MSTLWLCSNLRSNNAVDFDDLLGLTVALLKRRDVQWFYNSKFKHVLVDEFQVGICEVCSMEDACLY